MSDFYFATRLRWAGRSGVAKLHGRVVFLTTSPEIGGVKVHAIDYVPEIDMREIQRRPCDHKDDMTAAEVHDADALLRLLVPTI